MSNPEHQLAQSAQFIASRVKYKLVFLGNSNVGKTSIIERYIFDIFDEKNQPTVGIDFIQKEIQLNERTVRLLLWDTAGQEKFQSLIPSYIRDASCALVVYDISRKSTFNAVEIWYQQVKNTRGNDALIVLIGNKIDLEQAREVTFDEGQQYAKEKGMLFFEISAKTGFNVNQMVEVICQQLPSETSLGISQSQFMNQSQFDQHQQNNTNRNDKQKSNNKINLNENQTKIDSNKPKTTKCC